MHKRHSIILFAILLSNLSFAQNNDFGFWTEISLEKKLSDKLEVSLDNELRFNNNTSSLGQLYTQPGISYEIVKPIKFSLCYRYRRSNENYYYSTQHGVRADLTFKKDLSRLEISYRTRFQTKYSEIFSSENGRIPSNYFRNKLDLSYDIRKSPFKPFIAFEVFYPLNDYEIKVINKLRYTGGITYILNNKVDINVIYHIISEINSPYSTTDYILSLGFSYKL